MPLAYDVTDDDEMSYGTREDDLMFLDNTFNGDALPVITMPESVQTIPVKNPCVACLDPETIYRAQIQAQVASTSPVAISA